MDRESSLCIGFAGCPVKAGKSITKSTGEHIYTIVHWQNDTRHNIYRIDIYFYRNR
ncbi:hypothetical protein COPEUT_01228 [Coprococcus eutactus ATCC 27759]|nr:hypothetical protein COPEUT_01228 [Coprococcus eutactus ATCC 27759]